MLSNRTQEIVPEVERVGLTIITAALDTARVKHSRNHTLPVVEVAFNRPWLLELVERILMPPTEVTTIM